MSGGGAKGIAHIGVLEALEENNIPIDYITGTSSGAIIGGLYASGYTPAQIKEIFLSKSMQDVIAGLIDPNYNYYFKNNEENASWISIPFDPKELKKTTLPTSIVGPKAVDMELMFLFAQAEAISNNNFDSLMIPFRCVASDIEKKQAVVFKNAKLSEAVRASMTYPFYFEPLSIDDKVYFDGGLYNNFPADVMKKEFAPDYVIGSNVSSNEEPPEENDVISILRNMMISKSDYSVDTACGVLIEPKVNVGTFSFDELDDLPDSGYVATMRKIKDLKALIPFTKDEAVLAAERNNFNQEKPVLKFKEVRPVQLKKGQSRYARKVMNRHHQGALNPEQFRTNFYRLLFDDKVDYLFPSANYDSIDSAFNIDMRVKRSKSFDVEFGGVLSSSPINTGYVGLRYKLWRNLSYSLIANTYFGKFYNSASIKARVDVSNWGGFSIQPYYLLNRFNYFRSLSAFFELDRPSYLIQNENVYGVDLWKSTSSNSLIKIGALGGQLFDDYYQTADFGSSDIPDRTELSLWSTSIKYELNTLNFKQFANQGQRLQFSFRYSFGDETFRPGTTSSNPISENTHEWIDLHFDLEQYYKQRGIVRFGYLVSGHFSTLDRFSNYTATSLRLNDFSPIPESKTLFLESFRAFQYIAAGHRFIIDINNRFDWRLEGYIFQPYARLNRIEDDRFEVVRNFERRFTLASTSIVYQSPLGPLSVSANYYFNNPEIPVIERRPFTFIFQFGYTLFNRRAIID